MHSKVASHISSLSLFVIPLSVFFIALTTIWNYPVHFWSLLSVKPLLHVCIFSLFPLLYPYNESPSSKFICTLSSILHKLRISHQQWGKRPENLGGRRLCDDKATTILMAWWPKS
jgi:hypothetical protein